MIQFRARLNWKIVDLVKSQGLTHAEVAKKASASRTRITAILNGQTMGVSTDDLLRILYVLGRNTVPRFEQIRVSFEPGELDRLLAEAEQSGAALDGEKVFAELRNLSRLKQS